MTLIEDRPVEVETVPPGGTIVYEQLTDGECALAVILADPSGIDQAEFFWVDETTEDKCWRAFPVQWMWWRDESPRSVDACGRSVGKALATDTPILTPTGWTRMGALKVGDFVFDEQGEPVRVAEAFEVMHDRPCMEVTFDDGSKIVADEDHLWSTWTRVDAQANRRQTRRELSHGPSTDPRQRSRSMGTRTTREIAQTLRHGEEANHRIPVANPLAGEHSHLPIGPYTLGAWLGDGNSASARITISPTDAWHTITNIEAEGYVLTPHKHPLNYGIGYPYPVNHKTGTVTADLRRLGVRQDKHIPRAYLQASIEQRLALLQGIMDTDGHCTKQSGRCEITLANSRLAYDVYELILGLGQKAYMEHRRATCNGVDAGVVFRIGFRPVDILPFRMQRKLRAMRPVNRPSRIRERRIIDVQHTRSVPVRCIVVDNDSHLFLAGQTLIPTHNSTRIEAKALSFATNFPGEEHIIIAPEGTHLDALTDRIENRIRTCRFYTEMVEGGMGSRGGLTHRPFKVKWANGARTVTKLPQRSGIGVKGSHPVALTIDEAQDISDRTWNELPEVVKKNVPGATWQCHGVSKGVRDHFFDISQDDSGWTVHKITGLHVPTWDEADRPQKIKDYGGSEDSPDFIRNVYGMHGDSTNRIFVLQNLMACVDTNEGSEYNMEEYFAADISAASILAGVSHDVDPQHARDITLSSDVQSQVMLSQLLLPASHLTDARYRGKADHHPVIWMGMDVGLVADPSELVIWVEYTPSPTERKDDGRAQIAVPPPGMSRLKMIGRVRMRMVPTDLQADLVMHLIEHYRPRKFAIDSNGNGQGLFQVLQRRAGLSRLFNTEEASLPGSESAQDTAEKLSARSALTVIKGYPFQTKVVIEIVESEAVKLPAHALPQEILDKAGMWRNAKDASTEELRKLVDTGRLMLPYDREVINQMNGQTWQQTQEPVDQWGKHRRTYSAGQFHILDGQRFAALGRQQQPIEEMLTKIPKRAPVMPRFGL